jgi:putative ubiquitin-RnfH superfamily antitoxin RatB of RatAB toxin-antitoxin module
VRVFVAVALPHRQEVIELDLPEGATASQALEAIRLVERFPEFAGGAPRIGVWSRPCSPDTRLREGDRVEVYRALAADPKDQRRSRAGLKRPARGRP